jgi:transposase-like protein
MTMTELAESTDPGEMIEPMIVDIVDQKELAEQLLEQAKEQNIELVGPGGLLGQLTESVLETALDEEMSEHLGYEKHDPAGHFPNDTAALKCLYLVTRSLDPTGRGRARSAMRWKPALNEFAITFQGRIN